MKLSKTHLELLKEAVSYNSGHVTVVSVFGRGKSYGSRKSNAARALVAAGLLAHVSTVREREVKRGNVKVYLVSVYKLTEAGRAALSAAVNAK